MTKTIAAMFLFLLHGTVCAQTPSFQGKTITIVVGTVAGDLYDLYARAIGLFMGRYCRETRISLCRICRAPGT